MFKKQQQYSLKTLQKLYTKLINQQPFSSPSSVNIPQILNDMGKIIVWGQRQRDGAENGNIFDFICQVKLFDLLLQIFTKCKSVDTINAVIGFYNMLLTNINKPQTVMYLLSHPCILSMQLTKFGTMANELAEYYINFLKGLSRKIDLNTVHIFFNKRYPNFPLFFQTIRFFNHPENLVRTTCRNIILSIFSFTSMRNNPERISKQQQKFSLNQNQNQKQKDTITNTNNSTQLLIKKLNCIHHYLTSFPFCVYYIHEANFIKEYWKILDTILQPEGGQQHIQQYEIQNLDEIISDHEELLIYLDDLLASDQQSNINRPNSNKIQYQNSKERTFEEMFIQAFANQCLSQLVISLCSVKKAYLGIKTALLVFVLLLNNVRNQFFSQILIFTLFGKYYPKSMTHKLLNPIDNLLSYNREWKFKGFWDGHEDSINQFCAKVFYQDKSVKSDISKLNDSINQQKGRSKLINDKRSVFGMTPNYYQRQVQKLQKIFGLNLLKLNLNNDYSQINEYQTSKQNKSFSHIFRKFKEDLPMINSGNINLLHFDQNPVANNIYSFLESKNDTLVMLTLSLLEKVFTMKTLNPEVLNFCKLDIKPKTKDFTSFSTIQNIVLNCLRIFTVDPPRFRICTYKQAAKVFLHFIKLYENQDIVLPKEIINQSKKALKTAISRITPYMYGGKEWQKVVQLQLMISRKNNIRTYGLIPDQMMNQRSQNNTLRPKFSDQLYEIVPRNFDQQIGRDLWIFIIVKQMLAGMNTYPAISRYLQLKVEILPTKQPKASKYEQSKPYKLQRDQHYRAFYKRTNQQKYKDCEVVLLGGYIVIGSEQLVQHKLPYEQTYILADKSDPRKLLLQSDSVTISLQYDNLRHTLQMKDNFLQNKSLLLKCHLANLIKQIQSLLSQLE